MKKISLLLMLWMVLLSAKDSLGDIIVSFEVPDGQGTTKFIAPSNYPTGDADQLTWVPLMNLSVENTGENEGHFILQAVSFYCNEGNLISRSGSWYFPFMGDIAIAPESTVVTPIVDFAGAFLNVEDSIFYPAKNGDEVELLGVTVEYYLEDIVLRSISLFADEGAFLKRGEIAGSTADPVPEPCTMLLFGAGISALFIRSRKKE